MSDPILSVRDLTVVYRTRRGIVRAVDHVSYDIAKGEVYGLAGESGSGKSTVALALLGLIQPPGEVVSGEIYVDGRDVRKMTEDELRRFRWASVAMVFQGAMNAFNPVMKIGEQLADAMTAHSSISNEEALKHGRELLTRVGIDEEFAGRYPHELSGGMRQRAVIAMSLVLNPKLLVADEPTTSLDVIAQDEVIKMLKSFQRDLDLSVLYITHDLAVLAKIADRIGVMYAGQIVEEGGLNQLMEKPSHPYTSALMDAMPSLFGSLRELKGIPGSPPDPDAYPSGCRFHPRCRFAMEKCRSDEPSPVVVEERHYAACFLLESQGSKGQEKQ
ncbi:MAG: ABC transporter ATP-binding protein [Nitrososphaerota archaeon]|nr:ABC transporter ATP-binding protein [Nitrososphaerota archaeon]MDG6947272.1 ABC transporter ATP-binding protein [Nitrososphaerota archaeon]MDG6955297.1 ABC transporter ATP-binding protein [Nitrososphaerota archaeon]